MLGGRTFTSKNVSRKREEIKSAVALDAGDGKVAGMIAAGGKPEFASSCFSVSFDGSRYFCVVARDSWPSQTCK
jgi:hypothetical protein